MSKPHQIHLRVENQKGIHARVAAKIVQVAEHHNLDATLSHKDISVPLNSIMGLLVLSARKGALVTLSCTDPQAPLLFQDIEALFTTRFDEE